MASVFIPRPISRFALAITLPEALAGDDDDDNGVFMDLGSFDTVDLVVSRLEAETPVSVRLVVGLGDWYAVCVGSLEGFGIFDAIDGLFDTAVSLPPVSFLLYSGLVSLAPCDWGVAISAPWTMLIS